MKVDYPIVRFAVSQNAAPQNLTVRLQFESALDDGSAQYWVSILEEISTVTNAGGLAGAKIPPWESVMVPGGARRIGDSGLEVEFSVRSVDFGFFRVLHNALASAHVYNARLTSMDVQTNALDAVTMGTAEIEKIPYPGPARAPSYELHQPPPSPVDNTVTIEIEAPGADAQKVGPLMAALTAWGNLLLGAYPEDGQHPFSCVSDCTNPDWIGDTIHFVLPTFMGSESAFDAVVSMATRAAHEGLPISRVSIE